ncbi:MAG TPA: calcium-binding protein [Rubrobacteraceae bacterium]|nr:calcium-binding protein [Rubrobacteraceae bacterium]
MKALVPLVLTLLMAALAFASPAHAATVANGDFESGTLTGWTVVNQNGGNGDWYAYSGTASPQSGRQITAPPQGNFAATTDQTGPGSHVLYQDIALEENAEHTLSFILYYQNEAQGFSTPDTLDYSTGANQQYRVDILKPSADPFSVDPADILDSVYRTNAGDPNTLEPTPMTFDLSPYAGQTVRLRFAGVESQFFFRASVDDIKVETEIPPPPPDPTPDPKPACNDGRDNDADSKVDLRDPGCSSRSDNSEKNPTPDPNACTIKGNDRDNILKGTSKRDVICGLGGNDIIKGLGGNDLIKGGAGNDTIQAGSGKDVVYGGEGKDAIQGQDGADTLYGQENDDTLQGNGGNDKLYGSSGNDTLQGGLGRDVLRGGPGKDVTQQ